MKEDELQTVFCFGCGAIVPNIEGPTHEYMLSAPGCWKLYGEILAKEYIPGQYNADFHRITVDTYAVTHPGNSTDRRAIQSVNAHLVSLFFVFEKGLSGKQATGALKRIVENEKQRKQFVWLNPPLLENTLTVIDVLKAKNTIEHNELVRDWGKSVWKVWKDKHINTIQLLAEKLGGIA